MSNTDRVNAAQPMIEDPARNAIFEAALAAAPHAVQLAFWHLMDNGNIGSDDPIDVLTYAHRKPARLAAADSAIWSDQEIIEILTDAAEIDQVNGRALGHWEQGRLDQRDMIRRKLVR